MSFAAFSCGKQLENHLKTREGLRQENLEKREEALRPLLVKVHRYALGFFASRRASVDRRNS